jgi:CheY-like chemotaxis protein
MPSTLRLPARGTATAHHPRATPRAKPGPPPTRVLLADPCRDTVESLAWLLDLWGYDVLTAATGPAALESALAFRPDAVLMEIRLPELDGWQVARELRHGCGESAPLLVAVTVYGSERDRTRTREAGFDCHLVKPACPEVVREWLVTHCGHVGG